MGKKVLSLLLMFCMVISLMPAMSLKAAAESDGTVWDGTSSDESWYTNNPSADTYYISTAAQLRALADMTDSEKDRDTYNGLSEKTINLTNDIDLNGKEWTPIGTDWFGGTFNGNGHTISNLCETVANDSCLYGLFGYTNGTIINLNVSGSLSVPDIPESLIADVPEDELSNIGSVAGGIAGFSAGEIINCVSNVTIDVKTTQYKVMIGGITGLTNFLVLNCRAEGSITLDDAEAANSITIGGLCGEADENCSEYINCCSTMTLPDISGSAEIGALLGTVDRSCTMKNVYWSGDCSAAIGSNSAACAQTNCTQVSTEVMEGAPSDSALLYSTGTSDNEAIAAGETYSVIKVLNSGCSAVDSVLQSKWWLTSFSAINWENDDDGCPTLFYLPAITAVTPANGAVGVSADTTLTMTFNKVVVADSGNITIKNSTEAAETISVTDSNVSINNKTVTVTLPSSLDNSTEYDVLIDSGAFLDLSGEAYAGISDSSAWCFTTARAAPTGLTGVAPTSENGTDGSISGTTAAMEYKPVSGGDYTACADGSTTVGKAGNYLVRYAAADTLAASPTVTVYVPPYISHSVSGTVECSGSTVSGATVKVMQGNTQFGSTATTDANGKFTVSGVPDGEYNLVVTSGSRTITEFITVSGADYAAGIIALPNDSRNSILTITGDNTPSVVVNGLDLEAAAQNESSCTVTMTVTKKEADDSDIQSETSRIISIAGGQSLEYLKIDVTKTVGSGTPTSLDSLTNVQEIDVPCDFSGKTGITVYRYHGNSATAFTALSARPNLSSAVDGTFYADSANGKIYIYANEFSTYAIGYSTSSSSIWGGSSSGTVSYRITALAGAGGSISPSGSVSVIKGTSKTFTITPDDGYTVSDVLVDGTSVGAVSSYTFSDVTAAHTISAVFAKISGLPYYLDSSGNKVFIGFAASESGTMKYIAPEGETVLFTQNSKSFTDISGHWAKSYIDFVTQREIFVGTGGSLFSPDTGMTRAMFAAVIGRLYERSYGALVTSGTHAFTDCDYSGWYGTYVDWCAENGIIDGVGGGLFEPDSEITREEMAAILYRFADFLKVNDVTSGAALNYPDSANIDSWAQAAALYCQQTGIITGRDSGNFAPKGTATRAEVATILERFIETIV